MKKIIIFVLAILPFFVNPIICYGRDIEAEMQEKRAQVRRRAKQLIMVILRRDHAAIVEHSDYEGFSSSKGYRVDEFLEEYHGDHYNCAEIEIMSVEVFPGPTERAEVTVRAHLAVTPPHDVPSIRIDVWEFVNKRGDWLLVLRKQ